MFEVLAAAGSRIELVDDDILLPGIDSSRDRTNSAEPFWLLDVESNG